MMVVLFEKKRTMGQRGAHQIQGKLSASCGLQLANLTKLPGSSPKYPSIQFVVPTTIKV
jgi:hypothetical protein